VEKKQLQWFRSYLVIASTESKNEKNTEETITIYDTKNKYIAFQLSSEKLNILHIIQEWGSLFFLVKEKNNEGGINFIITKRNISQVITIR
jgi:hypothetical protein